MSVSVALVMQRAVRMRLILLSCASYPAVEASWRDGTLAETRFRLSAERTSPLKSAGASVRSTTGSRGVRISGSNAGYTMFWGSMKGTGYPLHSPVSTSLPLPCVTVCHHISTGVYHVFTHYLVNGTIFGIKLLNIKCVLIFYTTFVRSVSHRKKNWSRYYHKCTVIPRLTSDPANEFFG